MKTISFINMKGGVGKTTSVVEIATILVKEHSKKVLIIDIDPQTNATFSLVKYDDWENNIQNNTIANVLEMKKNLSSRDEDYDINKAVIEDVGGIENLDLISSHLELTFLDLDLSGRSGREKILAKQIRKLNTEYDFIIIDCPPNLNLAPQNALVASDYIITPMIPDFYSFLGLPLLSNRVKKLKEELDINVSFLGVIFTRVEQNTNLHTRYMPEIREICGQDNIHAFTTIIPKRTKISEAPSKNKPAYYLYPDNTGVKAYISLVKEILLKIEEEEE